MTNMSATDINTKGQPVKSSEIEIKAQRAAKKWLAGARSVLETNRRRTGDNFADAGCASFELATKKLAAIIATEFSALAETPCTEAFQWTIDVVPQWWKDATGVDSGATIDVSTGTVYIAGIRIAGRGDYILKVNAKLHGVPKVIHEALSDRLADEDDVEATHVRLREKYPDIGWICIEDKLYSEEGMLPSRQSTIQINSKIYGGASLAEALSAAMEGE